MVLWFAVLGAEGMRQVLVQVALLVVFQKILGFDRLVLLVLRDSFVLTVF